jgi:cytochrome P450/NADPH-cytochrome P450 reductase
MSTEAFPHPRRLKVHRRDRQIAEVVWYEGTATEALARAIRSATSLSDSAPVVLRDKSGAVLAFEASALPDGLEVWIDEPHERSPVLPMEAPGPSMVENLLALLRPGSSPILMLVHMNRKYGEFVRIPGFHRVIYSTTSPEIVGELASRADEFRKLVRRDTPGLGRLPSRALGPGLFTSSDDDPLWHLAHRILLPAFGAGALKRYYGRMLDVADDLFEALTALGPGKPFLVTEWMTRMTFEAIANAAFNTRFGAIDSADLPPFVQEMNVVLRDGQDIAQMLLPEFLVRHKIERRREADHVLADAVREIIQRRRDLMAAGKETPDDLLKVMLTTHDPVTGLPLPDHNIAAQLITFLIAGHETTSGLLSFALYFLWKHPEMQAKVIAEADEVLGRDYSYRPTYEDCARLVVTQRVLRETLRLYPTAPAFTREATRDTALGDGRFRVPEGSSVVVSLIGLHRNPRHWGPNPECFDPDRFLPANEEHRHPHAYHPFGMGIRACIGSQFAMLEAKMVLARFFQRFVPSAADSSYALQVDQTLTIKPRHFGMVLYFRPEEKGRFPESREPAPAMVPAESSPVASPVHAPSASAPAVAATEVALADGSSAARPLRVLYGSNMGTCRELAKQLSREALGFGFAARVSTLDASIPGPGCPWPPAVPVIIVTSTYNGTPPDNAAQFASWMNDSSRSSQDLAGVRFAVLGCGNKQWRLTFQQFPRQMQERLEAMGAQAFHARGEVDVDADFEAMAEAWRNGLWPALVAAFPAEAAVTAPAQPSSSVLGLPAIRVSWLAGGAPASPEPQPAGAFAAKIAIHRELQASRSPRSTCHIELPLPEGVDYRAGDHLGVWPKNPPDLVQAVAQHCQVPLESVLTLQPANSDHQDDSALPTGIPLTVRALLTHWVDLQGPVTRHELRAWAERAGCPPDRSRLQKLIETAEDYQREIAGARRSFVELLPTVPSVRLDLETVVQLRPAMKPRYYSISSSPLVAAKQVSITVGVHPLSAEGSPNPRTGLCSGYLARAGVGEDVRAFVKDTGSSFRLPEDSSLPVILVAAGTGIAPMRGFLWERHHLRAVAKQSVGQSILFFGCRRPNEDYIYREELEKFQREGTLKLLAVAFSRQQGKPKTYVQHLIAKQAERIRGIMRENGLIYVCGDARRLAPDVRNAFAGILGGEWPIDSLIQSRRYLQDTWSS